MRPELRKSKILSTLDSFPRVELEDIRHYFGADVPTRVRKQEFVDRLGAFIVEKPQEWLGNMLERDLRLLKLLVDAGPEVPLQFAYPDFPTVLESVKLVGSDASNEDYREVWIPKELYDIVSPYIDEAIAKGEADGSFELDRAALGYLNLYGVMTLDEFYDRMLDYNDWAGRWNVEEFTRELAASPVLKLCRFDFEGEPWISAPGIFDPEGIVVGRRDYPSIGELQFFRPQDALEAGSGSPDFVYGLGTKEGIRLVSMLDNLGYSGAGLVREEHEIWMNSQMVGREDAAEAIFASVTKVQDDIESFDEYNECMEIVAAYANSLPKWLLKGHSSDEANCLKVILQSEDDPLRALIKKNPLMSLFVPPSPMDDPCPCGSGLSYRFCHGRKLS
ncbi:MAG: SEC-C domain-containing protein [Bacteroidales bacterium]|nr:SEC-C domain-containing protein [Bacteroidales bacterium]